MDEVMRVADILLVQQVSPEFPALEKLPGNLNGLAAINRAVFSFRRIV